MKKVVVCVIVLTAIWRASALAQLPSGGAGASGLPIASGAGQCVVSTSAGVNYQAGSCGSGNLPALGAGGTILAQNTAGTAAGWVACTGDATCSTVTPGQFSVVKLRGNAVKLATPTDAQMLVWNNANSDWEPVSLSQDVTITNAGVASVVGTHITGATNNNLAAFNTTGGLVNYPGTPGTAGQYLTGISAAGAAISAQVACGQLSGAAAHCGTAGNEITTGVVPAANGGAGAVNGVLKANGVGTVSTAVSGTDYQAPIATNTPVPNQYITGFTAPNTFTRAQPTTSDISGLGTAATQNIGTSGGTVPLLNGANTWSGLQQFVLGDLAMQGTSTGYDLLNSSNTGATNFTHTFPAANDTIADTASVQTFTNKSISGSQINSGTIPAAQIPAPTASTLGGVQSFALQPSKFLSSISTSGIPSATQPACTDLTGAAAHCGTAANELTSGVVAATQGGAGTVSGIMKANGTGTVSAAASGTDYPPVPSVSCGQDNAHACGYNTTTSTWSNQAIVGSAGAGGSPGSVQYNLAGALAGVNISGLVKGNNTTAPTAAVAGTDYLAPPSGTAIQKANSGGALANATAGADYLAPPAGTSILKGNSGGALANAVPGTDYQAPISTSAAVASNWITGFTAPNTFTRSQPLASDISGLGTAATVNTGTSGATIPLLNGANTWSGLQTYNNSDIAMLGSSTGTTTITSDNAGALNFTAHLPAANDTITMNAATQTLTNKSIAGSEINSGTVPAAQGGAGTVNGIMKANGSGVVSAAGAGSDYLAPPSGTAIQKANSGGALANAVAGTDYQAPFTAVAPATATIGGTGVSNPTAHAVLIAEGSAAMTPLAMALDTVLMGAGAAADPTAAGVNNCGDATHALSYSTTTHAFGCQAITVSAPAAQPPAGSLQYNNAGSFAGLSGTGLVKNQPTSAPTIAVVGVDYAGPTTGTSGTPLFNNGAGSFTNGTTSGNTTQVATFSGTATPGRCTHTDASGNLVVTTTDCTPPPPGSTSGLPLFNNGSGGFSNGTATSTSGSTTLLSFTGPAPAARCLHTDANGNATVTTTDCGAGAGTPGFINTPAVTSGASTMLAQCVIAGCIDFNRVANGVNTSTLTLTTPASGGMTDGQLLDVEVDMNGTQTPSSIVWSAGTGVTLAYAVLGNASTAAACGSPPATGYELYNWQWSAASGKLTLIYCSPSPGPAGLSVGQGGTGSSVGSLNNVLQITNDTVTGTTANKLVMLTAASPARAILAPANTLSGIVGICDSTLGTCGTTGTAAIVNFGDHNCVFDAAGANGGHYVGISTVTAGACADVGPIPPDSGVLTIGRVYGNCTAGATCKITFLSPADMMNSGSGAVSITFNTIPNGGTGTAVNKLAGIVSSTMQTITTTATSGVQGICVANCGTGTVNPSIQVVGAAPCSVSGTATPGDYVQADVSTAGNCLDAGSTFPTGGNEVVGTFLTSVTGGIATVMLWGPDVANSSGTGGGGINSATTGSLPYYSGATTIKGNNQVIYVAAYTTTTGAGGSGVTYPDIAHAAQSMCPTNTWASGALTVSNLTAVTDTHHNLEYATVTGCTGGPQQFSASGPPTWPASGTVGNFSGNTQTGACTGGGTGTATATWHAAGWGISGSNDCTLVFTPGSYTLVDPLIFGIGGSSSGAAAIQTYPGANITTTNTPTSETGLTAGAAMVVGNHGTITGLSDQTGGTISAGSSANIDAVIETWSAFASRNLGVNTTTPNNSIRNIYVGGNNGTINKAVLWLSSVEGQADYSNLYVSAGQTGDTGILVDGASGQYNVVEFTNDWIVGNHTSASGIGLDVECSGSGVQSPNLLWVGGVIDDWGAGSAGAVTYMKVNGTCRSTRVLNPYFECGAETNPIGVSLTSAINFEGDAMEFNGCNFGDGVQINAGVNYAHVTGHCGSCGTGPTPRVINNITGYSNTGNGTFDYTYSSSASGAPVVDIGAGLTNGFGPGPSGSYYNAATNGIPACSATLARSFTCVSDASSCTSGTTYASAGSTPCLLECNTAGNAWKATGVSCF